MSSHARDSERAHDPAFRAHHAHEHPCAQSRGERRTHARDTRAQAAGGFGPSLGAPARGAHTFMRTRAESASGIGGGRAAAADRVRSCTGGIGSGARRRLGFDLVGKRGHERTICPLAPSFEGRHSSPAKPSHRGLVGRHGRALRRASPPCAHGTGGVKDSGIGARGEPGVTWTPCSGARTTLRTRVEGDDRRSPTRGDPLTPAAAEGGALAGAGAGRAACNMRRRTGQGQGHGRGSYARQQRPNCG